MIVGKRRSTSSAILKRSGPSGDGAAWKLAEYFCESRGWCEFSRRERWAMDRTVVAFRDRLVRAGFLPSSGG